MFARFLALLPLALLTSASHLEACDQYNTGSISCCNSVQTLNKANYLLGAFDLLPAATNTRGIVGLTCTPLTLIGTGSGCSTNQRAVCHSQDEFQGLVNLDCSPIKLNA